MLQYFRFHQYSFVKSSTLLNTSHFISIWYLRGDPPPFPSSFPPSLYQTRFKSRFYSTLLFILPLSTLVALVSLFNLYNIFYVQLLRYFCKKNKMYKYPERKGFFFPVVFFFFGNSKLCYSSTPAMLYFFLQQCYIFLYLHHISIFCSSLAISIP